MSLELDEALSLVSKLPFEEIIKEKFCEDLTNGLFEKHQSFLSNPLLLSIMLLTYGENAEIPSKLSIFYNQAYEALFQRHDANKGGYSRKRLTSLDIQDFSKVFSLFSLQTYEKRIFKMPRTQCIVFIKKSSENLSIEINPEDFLKDLLSAACLMIEDGLEIAFSHRSFQEYFVALQISNSSPEIQNKLIDRYWQNIAQDNVINLLQEINSDLVERVLIVPKLEVIYREIGVIRKLGITHYVKYLKYFFSEIVIDQERMYFVYSRSSREQKMSGMNQVLHMAVRKYSNLNIQINDEYKQASNEFYKIYGKVEKKSVYKTENLNVKSAFIKDLNKITRVNVDYLVAGYEAYKMLKLKHMNSVQNFDALLGIK